jgi:hypothetical protein
MPNCVTCEKRGRQHAKPRPLFSLSTRELVEQAAWNRDEVNHELSHRTSVWAEAARRKLEAKPLPKALDLSIASQPEDRLRDNWVGLVLRLCELEARSGNAVEIGALRKIKERIEEEWTIRRARGFSRFTWYLPIAGDFRGNSAPQGSLLKALGYRVGASSPLTERQRHWLLDEIISSELPPVVSAEYLEEWGRPLTPVRLNRVLRAVRGFASNGYGVKAMQQARAEWLSDARYLEKHWLVGSA